MKTLCIALIVENAQVGYQQSTINICRILVSTTIQSGYAYFFPQAEPNGNPQATRFSPLVVLACDLFLANSLVWISMSQGLSFTRTTLPLLSNNHCICIINKQSCPQSCISNIHFAADPSPQRNISVYPQQIKPTSLSISLCNSLFSGKFSVTYVFTPLSP